jgi:hypothetical protein
MPLTGILMPIVVSKVNWIFSSADTFAPKVKVNLGSAHVAFQGCAEPDPTITGTFKQSEKLPLNPGKVNTIVPP